MLTTLDVGIPSNKETTKADWPGNLMQQDVACAIASWLCLIDGCAFGHLLLLGSLHGFVTFMPILSLMLILALLAF